MFFLAELVLGMMLCHASGAGGGFWSILVRWGGEVGGMALVFLKICRKWMELLHFYPFLVPATIHRIWCFVLIFPYLLRASKSTCIPDFRLSTFFIIFHDFRLSVRFFWCFSSITYCILLLPWLRLHLSVQPGQPPSSLLEAVPRQGVRDVEFKESTRRQDEMVRLQKMVAERVIRLVVMCRQDAICGTPMRAAQVSDGWTGQCLRIA